MDNASEIRTSNVALQTAEHEELLNIIDTLRSQGISHYVDLPQIIVCGDQSSGKSSVLEAISHLRFPTKDNLCTRFATELILRRGPASKVTVTIIPGSDRNEQEAQKLADFKPPSTSIDDFATIVKSAEKAMGLDNNITIFSQDILRVELCGPTQPNLTLVDLPGIFWAGDRSQSDDDAVLVKWMVQSYMEKSRSIILAVVSAKSDLAMQIITKLAREIDPRGQRTLGIITKPDLLFAGSDSEDAFVTLARNENIHFKLGWHVIKNRDYDTKDTSSAERDASEKTFFQSRVWSTALPSQVLGIDTLRPRLSRVLLRQIEAELPSLMRDVEKELQVCKDKLASLGAPRGNLFEQRAYLFNSSQQFADLIKASIRGIYQDSFFGSSETDDGYVRRLRAVANSTLAELAETMRVKGHAQDIVDTHPSEQSARDDAHPEVILRAKYHESVIARMRRNRGWELPGLFNPSIVSELFFDQSRPWKQILQGTEERMVTAARTTVGLIIEHTCDSVTGNGIMRFIIRPNMESVISKLHDKVEELLIPHTRGHAITFNHYFTDNLQKKRKRGGEEALTNKLERFFGVNPASADKKSRWIDRQFDIGDLRDYLLKDTETDMDKFASIEATNAMEAYYKVALKTVIDAFGIYAIEGCLLNELSNLFTPATVCKLSDAAVTKIAGETLESVNEREDLNKKFKVLQESMTALQRLRTFRGPEDADAMAIDGLTSGDEDDDNDEEYEESDSSDDDSDSDEEMEDESGEEEKGEDDDTESETT